MKKFKLFAFVAISALAFSCSSDGGDSNDNGVDQTNYFHYKADGVNIPVPTITAVKHGDMIEILAQNADGRSMYLFFNKYGQLSRATSTEVSSDPFNWKNSGFNFSLDSFDFEIVALDEAAKIVKVNYSGKLFEDEYDQETSPFVTVTGDANVHYTEVAPSVPGLAVTASIAGNDWRAVKSGMTNNGSMDNVIVEEYSDNDYMIGIYLNDYDTTTGTFTFTGASNNNKVVLSKYNPLTFEYTEYVCSGSLVLNERTSDDFGNTLISGTFSFTAVDGSNTIQVTNGVFKELYNW